MKHQNKTTGLSSGIRGIVTAVTASVILIISYQCQSEVQNKPADDTSLLPNSKFSGVQIGTITYSWRDQPGSVEDILKYCQESGVSSIELMGDAAESFAGLPPSPTQLPEKLTPEQQTRLDGILKMANMPVDQIEKNLGPAVWKMIVAGVIGTTEEQVKWRTSVAMTRFEELRKMFNDAGVEIHIVKFSPAGWSDAEIDYAFKAAKALGAKGITEESGLDAAKRLAPFAEKHGMYVILHNHFQFADPNFNIDEILAVSSSVMLNFDCGHYYGSTGLNPAEFIEKYNNRIFSLHLKDKTGPTTTPPNENQVWGQGQVPIADVLLLLKKHANDEGWPKYADIELEYPVAAWSNSVKEVKTCVEFARQILL